jgi:hypothetical protein
MEHPPYSPELAPNDFWLFPKSKPALKGRRFLDTEDIKKGDDSTESYSTTEVTKNVSNSCSIVGLNAQLPKGSI